MQYSDDEKAIIWLSGCMRFDYRTSAMLLRAVHSPAGIFTADQEFFTKLIKNRQNGLYKSVCSCSERKKAAELFIAEEERKGRFFVTAVSADYPKALLQISDPPFVLYGEGNRELLSSRKFAIVGSRITPPWAEATAKRIAGELVQNFTIVTGLAEGGDAAAVAGAIDSGKLICVLPNGLNECYPASHTGLKNAVRRKGLLLSECLPDEKVKKYSFYARNRLLAGLCEGVLVVSAGERSGALITANRALEYGRDVFALPHNVGVRQGEGCNNLLKSGAYPVTDSADILFNYGIEPQTTVAQELSSDEERVLGVLHAGDDMHVTEIADGANMRIYEVSALLTALEMKNLVVRAGANRYAAIK